MSRNSNSIDFLCGKVVKMIELPSGGLMVFTRDDSVFVGPNQKAVVKRISVGKRRMIILRDGVVLGLFGRPRIRLLGMVLRGALITQEVIECYLPMYPTPERTFPKWFKSEHIPKNK